MAPLSGEPTYLVWCGFQTGICHNTLNGEGVKVPRQCRGQLKLPGGWCFIVCYRSHLLPQAPRFGTVIVVVQVEGCSLVLAHDPDGEPCSSAILQSIVDGFIHPQFLVRKCSDGGFVDHQLPLACC